MPVIGDLVRTPDGQTGTVLRLFETPWDTIAQGADNTKTVAHVEGEGVYGEWFADSLLVLAS